jgi:P27 family predicted phage terminase small subunit
MDTPEAPAWIRDNERAHTRWKALWPTLDPDIVDPVKHFDYVCLYCQAYADMRDANERLAMQGKLVKDKYDRIVPNPYVTVAEKAVQQMTELGRTLGLNTRSRWDELVNILLLPDEDLEDDGDAGTERKSSKTGHTPGPQANA